MSNHDKQGQGKRGFVRPQQLKPPVCDDGFAQARTALEAAERELEAGLEAPGRTAGDDEALLDGYCEARDRLLSQPATTGPDAAFKLAILLQLLGETKDLREPADRQAIIDGEASDERAALALYFDLMGLGHLPRSRVSVEVPGAHDFDPAAFVSEYRALGGDVEIITDARDGRQFFGMRYPQGGDRFPDRARELESELVAQPWKQALVTQYLRETNNAR